MISRTDAYLGADNFASLDLPIMNTSKHHSIRAASGCREAVEHHALCKRSAVIGTPAWPLALDHSHETLPMPL